MEVVQLCSSFSRDAGGMFYSVRYLSRGLMNNGVSVQALCCTDRFFNQDAGSWAPVPLQGYRGGGHLRFSPALRAAILARKEPILHSHAIWQYPSWIALDWKKRGRIHIASPRGMLEPWGWQYNAWKKRPIWYLFEKRNMQSAHALHATSAMEAANLRKLGLRPPIAVIPNGVELPSLKTPQRHHAQSRPRRTALFLSRIHPKKGLLNLVGAWARVRPKGWEMVVCGPDELGHTLEVQEAARSAGVGDCFRFVPPSYGEAKDRLFREADLFVLPTYSENFGNVVVEAMAYGVPVITTKGAPWAELESRGAGWWIDIGMEPLVVALEQATTCGPEDRAGMGERGRDLVEEKYTWPKIAGQMKSVYEWLLNQGPRPACVES